MQPEKTFDVPVNGRVFFATRKATASFAIALSRKSHLAVESDHASCQAQFRVLQITHKPEANFCRLLAFATSILRYFLDQTMPDQVAPKADLNTFYTRLKLPMPSYVVTPVDSGFFSEIRLPAVEVEGPEGGFPEKVFRGEVVKKRKLAESVRASTMISRLTLLSKILGMLLGMIISARCPRCHFTTAIAFSNTCMLGPFHAGQFVGEGLHV